MILCACGCGQEIIIKKRYISKYIKGHNMCGKHHSKETKEKISKSERGKYLSEETKRKMSDAKCGKNHPLYDKHRSKETKQKLSKAHLGKHLSEETKKKMSESKIGKHHSEEIKQKISISNIGEKSHMYGKHLSEEHRKKLSISKCGERHPNWKGGLSFEPYCFKFNDQKKEEIRNEYNRKCYICGKDEKDNITKNRKICRLSIHHVDKDKEQGCNGKQWKLIPLCLKCHGKIHTYYKFDNNIEHIRDKFIKIIMGYNRVNDIKILDKMGILKQIIPEMEALKGIPAGSIEHHPEKDIFIHTIAALSNLSKLKRKPSLELILAAIFHDIGKPATYNNFHFYNHESMGASIAKNRLEILKFPIQIINRIVWLINNHMKLHHFDHLRNAKKIRIILEPQFLDLLDLLRVDIMVKSDKDLITRICRFKEDYKPKVTLESKLVTGYDVMNLGVKPSPLIAELLTEVEDQVLEGTIITRDQALDYLQLKLATL